MTADADSGDAGSCRRALLRLAAVGSAVLMAGGLAACGDPDDDDDGGGGGGYVARQRPVQVVLHVQDVGQART